VIRWFELDAVRRKRLLSGTSGRKHEPVSGPNIRRKAAECFQKNPGRSHFKNKSAHASGEVEKRKEVLQRKNRFGTTKVSHSDQGRNIGSIMSQGKENR